MDFTEKFESKKRRKQLMPLDFFQWHQLFPYDGAREET